MTVTNCVPKSLRFIRLKDTGEKKGSDIPAAALTIYLTICVGSLLSVALFGCNFSIANIWVIIAFTQLIFHTRISLNFIILPELPKNLYSLSCVNFSFIIPKLLEPL